MYIYEYVCASCVQFERFFSFVPSLRKEQFNIFSYFWNIFIFVKWMFLIYPHSTTSVWLLCIGNEISVTSHHLYTHTHTHTFIYMLPLAPHFINNSIVEPHETESFFMAKTPSLGQNNKLQNGKIFLSTTHPIEE